MRHPLPLSRRPLRRVPRARAADASQPQFTYAPPQSIALLRDRRGRQPRVPAACEGLLADVDPVSLRRTFVVDPEKVVPIGFFVQGPAYKMWGLIPMDLHLIGPLKSNDTDVPARHRQARPRSADAADLRNARLDVDRPHRRLHQPDARRRARLPLGLLRRLGRPHRSSALIEVICAMPTIPLWLGLAAAIPLTWSPLTVYFVITLIVSLFGWTGLAREVRGRFFALRGEDFVTAARLDGSSERRLIFRHILPSLTSHILAVVTLALPTMIVAETALSFLGIGLKPPVVSWGVLLQDAQNVRTIATAPWLLIWPARAVVLAVLAFNFLGDGLRDAADPYETLMGTKPNGRPTLVHPAPSAPSRCSACATSRSTSTCARTSCTPSATSASSSAAADARPRRRERLGQERHRPGAAAHHRQERRASPAAASCSDGDGREIDIARSTERAARSAAHPRRPHRPDLPGADDARCRRSTPSAPDRRGAAAAPQARQARRPRRRRSSCCARSRSRTPRR